MALSQSALESEIAANLGFALENQHCQSMVMINAIAGGICATLKAKAHVSVNPHAGGTYYVLGVSDSDLSGAVKAQLSGFNLKGAHAKGALFPEVVCQSVALSLSSASISVPVDISGAYRLQGYQDTSGATKSALESKGIVLTNQHCRTSEMIDAVCSAVDKAVTQQAQFNVNAVSGGQFFLI